MSEIVEPKNINEQPTMSITPEQQPEVEASKAAAQSAIDELQKIVNFDSANKDAATVKKEITALKNAAKKNIDEIMKSKGTFGLGIFGFGGSKKKVKKSKRKSQKK
jgi:hypothetical protein